jgi:hypothetical protein
MKLYEPINTPQRHLFVIGVHKAGTTSLYKYLAEQRRIFRPEKKELHFFTKYLYNDLLIDYSGYLNFFKGSEANQILLDVSPSYLYGKARLATALKSFTDSQYLVMLRDPVSRFISFYHQSLKRGEIEKTMTLREFFIVSKHEFESGTENNSYINRALREGCYSIYLNDWIKIIGKDLKIVFFENFIGNTELELNNIYEWLKLETPIKRQDYSVENKSFVPNNSRIHNQVLFVYSIGEKYFRKLDWIVRVLKPMYLRLNGSHKVQQVTLDDLEIISSFYSTYNDDLKSILEQFHLNLPRWLEN